MSYRGFKRLKSDTYTHTHAHTYIRTPAKNHILDVLEYSEYSGTNSSEKNVSRQHNFLREEVKKQFLLTLATRITVIYTEKSDKITYVL